MQCSESIINFSYKGVKFKVFNSSFGYVDVKRILALKSELDLYNFFLKYKKNYRSFADVGANVGIHTLFASKIFKFIYSYEPLKTHYNLLKKNIVLNNFKNIKIIKKAVSIDDNNKFLIELEKNTTATHLETANRSKYGKLKKWLVKCISIKKIISKFDLIKFDVEGLEAKLLKNINFENKFSDLIVEIHNYKNSKDIFKKLSSYKNISIYKIKNLKISPIKTFKDMPKSSFDGHLFVTKPQFKI